MEGLGTAVVGGKEDPSFSTASFPTKWPDHGVPAQREPQGG